MDGPRVVSSKSWTKLARSGFLLGRLVLAAATASVAFSCIVNRQVEMTLLSNIPDTKFRYRVEKLDALPDDGWQDVGSGQNMKLTLSSNTRFEIAAEAPKYKEKRFRFTEPIKVFQFDFLSGDLITSGPERSPDPGPVSGGSTVVLGGAPPAFTGQRHALIVGISSYSDDNYQTLNTARADAEALANFLQSPQGGNISSERVQLLVDGKATKNTILENLIKMSKEAQPGDLLIIYFACHGRASSGEKTGFLVPYDGKFNAPEATGIEKDEIERRLDAAEAKRQLVVMDCCFGASGVVERGEMDENPFKKIASGWRVVITSTKASETAVDRIGKSPTSPFATALLNALGGEAQDRDANGKLTADELHNFLAYEVQKSVRAAVGKDMHPQLYGDKAADLEVIKLRPRSP